MQGLRIGTRLRTMFGKEVRVLKRIDRGGQGSVYKVDCSGREMALKWYDNPSVFIDKDKFYRNLKNNIIHGSPSDEFMWPQDITESLGDSFGYVMELAPPSYISAEKLALRPSLLPSFRRAVDACLGIATAFNQLHNKGYRYQDISDGNILIDPKLGKVLIIDNDNVTPEGGSTGIAGTPFFMAPEIVAGKSVPTVQSDLHSMAVVIFYLLLFQDPLKGIKMRHTPLDSAGIRELLGTDPVFIFDPDDHSNAAIQSPDNNALRVWPCLPQHMKDTFVRAFSKSALHNPGRRLSEMQWIRELVRFRSEIVTCRCGNEVFLDGTDSRRCEQCGCLNGCRLRMEIIGNKVPVANDARIYACQANAVVDMGRALDLQLWALASKHDPHDVVLRNVSQTAWPVTYDGKTMQLAPGQQVRAVEGLEIEIMGETLRVCRNTD